MKQQIWKVATNHSNNNKIYKNKLKNSQGFSKTINLLWIFYLDFSYLIDYNNSLLSNENIVLLTKVSLAAQGQVHENN